MRRGVGWIGGLVVWLGLVTGAFGQAYQPIYIPSPIIPFNSAPVPLVNPCMMTATTANGQFLQYCLPVPAWANQLGLVAGNGQGPLYYAKQYKGANGACLWDATHENGGCINAAIAAASAGGGGDVWLPCGIIGFSTLITNNTSGVRLHGCGLGFAHDQVTGLSPTQSTVLRWIGGPASLGLDIEPTVGVGNMTSAGATDFWVDGQGQLTTIIRIASVSYSDWKLGATNRGSGVGFDLSTQAWAHLSGLNAQYNTGEFFEASDTATGGVGILFRADPGSSTDWSLNTFTTLFANDNGATGGTPIVFAAGDTNMILQCASYDTTGVPDLITNSTDTLPAGLTNGSANTEAAWRGMTIKENDCPLVIHALMSGATFVANTVAGTEGPTTIPVTTTATVDFASVLGLVSNAGIVPGEVINLTGGYQTGVPPNSQITLISGNGIGLAQQVHSAVAGGIAGVVSWGAIAGQATTGAYTLTYNASETGYDLVAPPGGDSQTAIRPAGGALIFTDFVIPWTTGTPVNGDSWTITLPARVTGANSIYNNNVGNAIPYPFWEANYIRSGGCYGTDASAPCTMKAAGQGDVLGTYGETNAAINGGMVINSLNSSASSPNAVTIGGASVANAGVDSVVIGGHGNSIASTCFYCTSVGGQSNNLAGESGEVASNGGNDFGRFVVQFQGSGLVNVTGDAQSTWMTFHSTSSAAATASQATSNGNAANPTNNCDNIATGTGYALERVTLFAYDHTTQSTNWYTASWGVAAGPHVLTRPSNVASTVLDGSASTIAPELTRNAGTGSTASATISADQTNGCLKMLFTTPTGNSDQWIAVWKVSQVESQ